MDLPPLPPDPSVSVVIPARNSAKTLRTAVESALVQRTPGSMEVVIAVGPSDDDTEEIAAALAAQDERVRWVPNPPGITPAALNTAIAASTGQVVVRLDGHARLDPGYIELAIDTLRRTGAVNVGGTQRPVADGGFAQAVAHAMASPAGAGGAAYRTGTDEADVETVYLGVFRREALEHVGGYDEELVRNQDYELNHRLRLAGGSIWFHPGLAVDYHPRDSVRSLARQYHDYGAWKRFVLRRHPDSVKLRQLAAPVLVLGLFVGLLIALLTGTSWPFATLAGAYLLALLAAGVHAAGSPTMGVRTAVAIATMHLAWGTGFLVGRRQTAPRATATTSEHPEPTSTDPRAR